MLVGAELVLGFALLVGALTSRGPAAAAARRRRAGRQQRRHRGRERGHHPLHRRGERHRDRVGDRVGDRTDLTADAGDRVAGPVGDVLERGVLADLLAPVPPTASTVPPTTLLPSFFWPGCCAGPTSRGSLELAWRAVRRCSPPGPAPRQAGRRPAVRRPGRAGAFASGNRVGNATGSHVDGAAWPASSTAGEAGPRDHPGRGTCPDEVGGVNGAFIAAVSPKTEPAASSAPAAIAPRRRSGCRAGRVERISPTAGVLHHGQPGGAAALAAQERGDRDRRGAVVRRPRARGRSGASAPRPSQRSPRLEPPRTLRAIGR